MHNDEELIQACLRGERSAQKRLYDKFAGKLFAIAMRYMKSKDDAADVLQDAFIKIYGNLDSFKYNGPFEIWLRRIVINTALTALGRKKINYDIDDYEPQLELHTQNLGLENLGYEILQKLINELPEGCRTVFNLFAIEGYKHIEIAEQLNIAVGTSKSQYSKARTLLMEKLENEKIV